MWIIYTMYTEYIQCWRIAHVGYIEIAATEYCTIKSSSTWVRYIRCTCRERNCDTSPFSSLTGQQTAVTAWAEDESTPLPITTFQRATPLGRAAQLTLTTYAASPSPPLLLRSSRHKQSPPSPAQQDLSLHAWWFHKWPHQGFGVFSKQFFFLLVWPGARATQGGTVCDMLFYIIPVYTSTYIWWFQTDTNCDVAKYIHNMSYYWTWSALIHYYWFLIYWGPEYFK